MFGIFKAVRQRRQRARTAQHELIVAFDAIGSKFMHLDPVIRQALLKEAMVTDADWATKIFIDLENAIQSSPKYATDESKATALRELYCARAAKFDAAQVQARANLHRR